ncbi:Ribonuclease H [Abeliophyllum distichum]|uniref:Ribonuclease H n=1 Tax=Abeliophyllum distichum TaxID=126358 RepID=A0ABD1Q5P7_9LAMI
MDLASMTGRNDRNRDPPRLMGPRKLPSSRNKNDNRSSLCRRAYHELIMKLRKGSKRGAPGELASPWALTKKHRKSRSLRRTSAFDQMDVDHELTAISELLFGFMEDSLIPRGKITFVVDFGEPPCHLRKFIIFLIVDTCSAYHRVLGRPALKDLQAVTSIQHLAMTFPMPEGSPRFTEIRCSDSLASQAEELEVFPVNPTEPTHELKMEGKLEGKIKEELKRFLWENTDIFARKHSDMVGIDPSVAYHALKVDLIVCPKIQKRRHLSIERYGTLKEEVDCWPTGTSEKPFTPSGYPTRCWLQLDPDVCRRRGSHFVHHGPRAILLQDDALWLEERMSHISETGESHVRRNMEVYVDDMLVKSLNAKDHIGHLRGMFEVLRKYHMKLNPLKYTFGVASRKFLGYMVNQRGIEANLEKIQALIEIRSPSSSKEVQSLMKRLVALNRFISKATDRCQPFFQTIREEKKFEWMEE